MVVRFFSAEAAPRRSKNSGRPPPRTRTMASSSDFPSSNGYQLEVNNIFSVRWSPSGRTARTCCNPSLPEWSCTKASRDLSTAPLICCTLVSDREGSEARTRAGARARRGLDSFRCPSPRGTPMPSGAPGAFVSAPLTLGDAALFTDLYELTMAAAFFREGVGGSATFSLYVRRLPPERGFLVAAGLEDVLEYLRGFHFTPDGLNYIRSLDKFEPAFL